MSLWQIRYIWLPILVDLNYFVFMLDSVSMNFAFSLAVDYGMPASIIFTLLWSSHHNKCKI